MGEVLGEEDNRTEYRWLIDPIDGTKSFVRGIPTFGTIVALEDRRSFNAVVGAIHIPCLDELYVAGAGCGAWKNGAAISIGSAVSLADAVLSAPDAYQFQKSGLEQGYQELCRRCRHVRGYTDCLAHGLAASGVVDAFFEPYMHPSDIRATEVLVAEARGLCVTRRSTELTAVEEILGVPPLVEEIAALVVF
ncbi:MAG: hypothetical protein FJX52_02770 [Alphaproteobacteria bacterium]|nr:hypothetical protein [Alphaproteobacteria bacterium]